MPKFDLGTVFARFFKLVAENFALFLVIGLAGSILPAMAVTYVTTSILDVSQDLSAYAKLDAGGWLIFGAAVLVLFVLNLMTVSAITEVAILRAIGKPVSSSALIGSSLRNALPLFVVGLLTSLFIVLGFVVLIVPGVFLATCLCVAVPAYVGQPNLGIWGAVMKSFELTRGNRWWLVLIGIVLIVASMIVGAAFGGVMVGLAMSGGNLSNVVRSLPYQLANSALSGVSNLVGYVLAAAIYVCLREVKEKLSPENAASVFS